MCAHLSVSFQSSALPLLLLLWILLGRMLKLKLARSGAEQELNGYRDCLHFDSLGPIVVWRLAHIGHYLQVASALHWCGNGARVLAILTMLAIEWTLLLLLGNMLSNIEWLLLVLSLLRAWTRVLAIKWLLLVSNIEWLLMLLPLLRDWT
jgi:hypothetical protein